MLNMKLSLGTVFGLILCSYAAPLRTIPDIEALIERTYEIADGSEWVEINARTGPFRKIQSEDRKSAMNFIADSHNAIEEAMVPSHRTKTYASTNEKKTGKIGLHLDRQQPTNRHGDHKVAIQQNIKPGPSTIGQVIIHKDAHVSREMVAARLKHSLNMGQEFRVPSSPKLARIQENKRKHEDKMKCTKQKEKAGMERARNGIFRKGRKDSAPLPKPTC